MLSGLTFGDRSALEQEHLAEARAAAKKERKKHKKEKSKKHKKEKGRKQKERQRGSSGSDASGGSGSEDEWLKQQQQDSSPDRAAGDGEPDGAAAAAAAKAQREDWMTVPMASSLFGKQQEHPKEEKPAEPEEAPIVAGIRYMKPEQAAAAAERAAARQAAEAEAAKAAPAAGAAGVAWRVRALQRAQQLAKEQGKELNEVLSERWGSAADIAKGLMDSSAAAAAAAESRQQPTAGRSDSQRRDAAAARDGPAPHYLSSLRSERAEMKRPSGITSNNKLSWRRQPPSAAGGRDVQDRDGNSRGHEQDRHTSREAAAAAADDRRGQPEEQRQQQREGGRDRRQGDSNDGSREDDRYDRHRGHDRDRDRWDRERGSRDGRDRDRDGDHPDRGRVDGGSLERDRGRGYGDRRYEDRHQHDRDRRDGDKTDRGDGERRQPGREWQRGSRSDWQTKQGHQQQQQVVAALKAVAGSINTFKNDGSFMEQLAAQQADKHEQGSDHEAAPAAAAAAAPADSQGDGNQQRQQHDRRERNSSEDERAPAASAAAAPQAAADSNQSTAELLRARLGGAAKGAAAAAEGGGGGNRSVADALRARLAGRAPPAAAAAAAAAGGSKREVVLLPQVDASGRAMPGAFGREGAGDATRAAEAAAGGRLGKRVQRYGSDGTRERYFADDDNVDLQTLVKRARHGDDALDLDRTMAANIARKARFKEADLDADAEYDYDAGLELAESRRKRGTVEQQKARERQRQVAQFNKLQRLEDSCTYCFSSKARPKELAIAVGQSTYLSLVQRGRLVEGHCVIVPAEHVASTRQVDDATWTEVRNFQKCLIRMFMEQGKEVLFLETATGLGSNKHHAIMEVIPVDPDAFAKAPMYFKKALQEAESEWSQHAAKAVIDTKAKGLRGSIPPNFPYMYVQFGYANGFVHVIDDESKFDRQLGRQVVVGLLKLPPEMMHRRQRSDAPQVQASMATAFRKQFSPYDWTKALD